MNYPFTLFVCLLVCSEQTFRTTTTTKATAIPTVTKIRVSAPLASTTTQPYVHQHQQHQNNKKKNERTRATTTVMQKRQQENIVTTPNGA